MARRSVWARTGDDGPKSTTPPIPLAAACRMATASPILAPVMTRTAASCRFDHFPGSGCPVSGVNTLGGGGDMAAEGLPGVRTDPVVDGAVDPVPAVGFGLAIDSGPWAGPNKRAAPAPVAVATARAAKHIAAIRRPLGCTLVNGTGAITEWLVAGVTESPESKRWGAFGTLASGATGRRFLC